MLYQSREAAASAQLAYVNDAGAAVIKVDNTTNGEGDSTYGRASVKIYSNDSVSQGSLVVMDATHVPYGVSLSQIFRCVSRANCNPVLRLASLLDGRRNMA